MIRTLADLIVFNRKFIYIQITEQTPKEIEVGFKKNKILTRSWNILRLWTNESKIFRVTIA